MTVSIDPFVGHHGYIVENANSLLASGVICKPYLSIAGLCRGLSLLFCADTLAHEGDVEPFANRVVSLLTSSQVVDLYQKLLVLQDGINYNQEDVQGSLMAIEENQRIISRAKIVASGETLFKTLEIILRGNQKRVIVFSTLNHAMSLYFDGRNVIFYDPNNNFRPRSYQIRRPSGEMDDFVFRFLIGDMISSSERVRDRDIFSFEVLSKEPIDEANLQEKLLEQLSHIPLQKALDVMTVAIQNKAPLVARALIEKGLTRPDGACLFQALFAQNKAMLELFIKSGANVNQRTEQGLSCLEIAIGLHNVALIELLLQAGASFDDTIYGYIGANREEITDLLNRYKKD